MVSVAESRGRTVVSTSRAKNGQCLVSELNVIIPLPHKNHHFFFHQGEEKKTRLCCHIQNIVFNPCGFFQARFCAAHLVTAASVS